MDNIKNSFESLEKIKNLKERADQHVSGFFSGILDFLKDYAVIGMAIGVIIAQASKDLVDSIVQGLFLPFIKLFVSQDNFKDLDFYIRGVKFSLGSVIGNMLTFFIIIAFLYLLVKKIIKSDKLLQKIKKD
jgi:large-conductance mechanosensitive channel